MNDGPSTVGDLIRSQAKLRPTAPAVLNGQGIAWTYAELADRVAAGARVLGSLGIGSADRVVVVVPDGPGGGVAILAACTVAACVPVNPALREAEARSLLARLRPRAVLVPPTPGAVRAAATALGLPVLEVDAEGGIGRADATGAVPDAPTATDTALILPTSGTTGHPKLVPLTHRNVLAAAGATVAAYRLGPADRRLNVMPLFHVQGIVGSLVASLLPGGSIACLDGFSAAAVVDGVESLAATWYSATPTMHRDILRCDQGRLARMTRLRFVRSGSVALPARLRAVLEDRLQRPVIESYGMTEAHQIASTPFEVELHRPGTVGRPTGARVTVLAADGSPVPTGTVGELAIRGDNVMAGYADDPEANAASFVDGWFRTGDLGSVDGDGYLTIHGRLKELINRGGEKISPAEVDRVLLEHPAVAEAVTFGVAHPRLHEDVAAAVVPRQHTRLDVDELRRFVAGRLAPFKVPRHVAVFDVMPAAAAGSKVRRADLAEAIGLMVQAETTQEPARPEMTTLENAVAGVWCRVLRLPQVSADDDFFYLGGDSLTGAQILADVHEIFAVRLQPMQMYDEASTVAGMARLIHQQRAGLADGAGHR